ncbi:MAG: DUF1501 domain-containing protein [Phycisphaerae bacterium]|nr:DUF1501 domain-containing protein [Phycisphaerae bacterium]
MGAKKRLVDPLGLPLSRRDLIKLGLAGAVSLALPMGFATRLLTAAQPPAAPGKANARAKAVIQIWMWGGPSHLDTFDPKPEAGYNFHGGLDKPIATNVDGIRICELLPNLAKQADKYSILRGMTHNSNAHETASYLVQTGRSPSDRIVYPGVGAVVSLFKGYDAGYRSQIPPYIVMTELQGRFSEAGFLGGRCQPFATGGDPGQGKFNVEGITTPGVSEQRQADRRELLKKLDTLDRTMKDDPQIAAADKAEKEAYELLADAGKLFDLSQEKDEVRDRYGRNTFGASCLMARRLVERGVPYITINSKGWDTHKQHFQTIRRRLPEVDRGFAALLADLAERNLLDSTIVWWGGEFGRTPRVQWDPPWNGGRGHWGAAFSSVVAGGGFKGGHVVGATDATGESVKDRPVYPCDLIASIYELLGIDLDAKLPHPQGLDVRVTPRPEEDVKSAGRLKEIM